MIGRTMYRPAVEDDRERLAFLISEAFMVGAPPLAPDDVDLDHRYVFQRNQQVEGTVWAIPDGQYFAGRLVPSLAVRGVAVSPSARGTGVVRGLMRYVLSRYRDQGTVVSALYPSVPAPYRSLGYELAGDHMVYRAPAAAFPVTKGPALEEWDDDDLDEVTACHRRWAAQGTGAFEHDAAWWRRVVVQPYRPDPVYRYLVRENGEVTGYLLYRKRTSPRADLHYYFDVDVRDVVALTPVANAALLTHLAGQRALGLDVCWPGSAGDPWQLALGPQVARVDLSYPWMLRLLDVRAAIAARGYADGVRAAATLRITDDEMPDNANCLRIELEGGTVSVDEATGGDTVRAAPTIDAGALASLLTGWSTPAQLAAAGRLVNAGERALADLATLFAGPRPWLADMF